MSQPQGEMGPATVDETHYCAFHPKVETELRCSECERYICPKDMVPTPVGYKCRECAKPARGQYVVVKPGQILRLVVSAIGLGIGLGAIFVIVPFGGIFVGAMCGLGVAELLRRASGGHRTWEVGFAAIGAIAIGVALAWFFGGGAEFTGVVAVVAALVDLSLLGRR